MRSYILEAVTNDDNENVFTHQIWVIEIEGVQWIQKQHTGKGGGRIAGMLQAMESMYDLHSGSRRKSIPLPEDIDIISEFELVQQKKSNLSVSLRKKVVNKFEDHFKQLNTQDGTSYKELK